MGAAAPSGIVTLVLIESTSGPISERLLEECRGLPLESDDPNLFPAVFDRATDGLTYALQIVKVRRAGARAAIVTHEMELENSANDQWAFQRAQALLKGAFDGMILVSSGTREVLGHYPEEFGLMKLGRFDLPDLERPETIYRLTHRTIPSTFPRATRFSTAPNNLPSLGGAFIGREVEKQALLDLAGQSRRIVLLGPAGIGKSRLAVEVGQDCMEQDYDGVWFIDLRAGVNIQERIGTYVADKIGAAPDPTQGAVARIAARLKNQVTLLIFDGCEVAANAVARLIPRLTSECPNLLVVLTTQVPLNLEKQAVYEVPPLSGGPFGDAAKLFAERVALTDPDFLPEDKEYGKIADLCDQLANVPMAIELVAPIYKQSKGKVTIERSQKSVVIRTLDWITSNLSPEESELAIATSVFRGPVRAESAIQTARTGTADDLVSLSRKALLIPEGSGSFRVPSAVRDYFEEAQPMRVAEFDEAHAHHFLKHAQQVGEAFEDSGDTAVFGDDIDNFHQALDSHCRRANAMGAFGLCFVLFDYWFRDGRYKEGLYWLQRAIDVTEDPFTRARLMNLAASMALGGADFIKGNDYADQGISIAQQLKSDILLARLYSNSGLLLYGQCNYQGAIAALREAKKCARKIGQETTVPDLFMALVLAEAGQYAKAEKIFDSIKIDRLPPEMRNYYDLRRGIMRNFEGRWGEAKEFLESALQFSHGKQDLGGICGAIRSLVITYANLGLETQSARMVGAAEALSERSFDFWPDKQRDLYTATITKVVARLGQSLFDELKSEGYDTSIDRIVNELEWKWPPPPG